MPTPRPHAFSSSGQGCWPELNGCSRKRSPWVGGRLVPGPACPGGVIGPPFASSGVGKEPAQLVGQTVHAWTAAARRADAELR